MTALWAAGLYRAFLRPWMYTWGARSDEIDACLPGDDLTEGQQPRTTRAISIPAPADAVWPWLAQIGEDRGGFYSYSLLERAAGTAIHNAHSIHPQWQRRRVGDTVWLARRYGRAARQIVADVRVNSHLILVSPNDFARLASGGKATGTWSFVLRPDDGATRLIVRGSGGAVGHFWFDIPHFVMEQKMMRGIRDRVLQARRPVASVASVDNRSPHLISATGPRQAGTF